MIELGSPRRADPPGRPVTHACAWAAATASRAASPVLTVEFRPGVANALPAGANSPGQPVDLRSRCGEDVHAAGVWSMAWDLH